MGNGCNVCCCQTPLIPRILNMCCWALALFWFVEIKSKYQLYYDEGISVLSKNSVVPNYTPIKNTLYATDYKSQLDTLLTSIICGSVVIVSLILWTFFGKNGQEWKLQLFITTITSCCIGILAQYSLSRKFSLNDSYRNGEYSNLAIAINGYDSAGFFSGTAMDVYCFILLSISIVLSIWGGFSDYKKKRAKLHRSSSELSIN